MFSPPLDWAQAIHLFWYLLQGAALGNMVGQMTYGKRQFESVDGTVRQLIPIMHSAMDNLLPFIDADTAAFKQYMVGARLFTRTAYLIFTFGCCILLRIYPTGSL
jgi:hypothetical protein